MLILKVKLRGLLKLKVRLKCNNYGFIRVEQGFLTILTVSLKGIVHKTRATTKGFVSRK